MADVAVVGTAAADVVLRVPRLPTPGDHLSGASLGWRLGGGSANVACALAAAGHRVELVGPFGDDAMADALLAELARRGVGTGRTFRVRAPTPRALILLDAEGERAIVGLDRAFSEDVYPLSESPDVGAVDGLYVESYRRFPADVADRAAGALVIATAPQPGVPRWPADVLAGSERDYPPAWGDAPYAAAREVAGTRLRWVVVTRGVRGADAYGEGTSLHVDARPATQVDTTGAGDAFAAGLLSGLLAGWAMEKAMLLAADWGASAVGTLQSISPIEIEALDGAWPGGGPRTG